MRLASVEIVGTDTGTYECIQCLEKYLLGSSTCVERTRSSFKPRYLDVTMFQVTKRFVTERFETKQPDTKRL